MAISETANLPGRGIKPLVSLRAHARLALIVFIVTLLAGMPLVFIKGEAYYSATAVVQVAPRYMKNLRDDGELDFPSNTQYREFLEQQTRSVGRYDIVRDALNSLGEKAANWRKAGDSERKSVEQLRTALLVRSVPDTYMIEVQLQSKSKDGLAEVVNAVVATYVERMRSERVFGADARVRMLEAREAEILSAIREKTEKRTELALQLGIGAFSGKEENPYDRVLADLRTSLADARGKRFEAEAQLKAFETNGETDIKTRSIQEAVLIDPGLSNLKANLFKRRADLLTQLSGLQPQHPVYAEVSEELKRIDGELGSQTSKLKDQVQRSLHARYKTGVDQSLRLEANLKGDLDDMVKKGAAFANLYNQAMTLSYDIDQQRKELDAIRERLNHFAAEQNSFGFVRLVTPALAPETPYGPGKKKLLLLLLAAALLLTLAAPVAADLMDRRIQTVNDAEKVLGVPALGWMVERSDEATQLFGTDLLRRMAGSLINERQRHGTRVFAFSGVKAGAGVSELVLALGKTLDTMGYRALALEANALRKDARYAGGRPGLIECLRAQAEASACIVPADAAFPARMQVGGGAQQAHIDQLERMQGLTRELAQDFSFVLVDLPPLLLSADAEILARNLEHLIVIVEANGTITGELRRAGRQLEKLDPAAVGIVVNRVRPFDGGGYLHGAMLEYLSGRKLSDYFTTSSWALAAQARWVALQMRHPVLGAVLDRAVSLVQALAAPGKLRSLLLAALILAALAAGGAFLARNPGVWMDWLADNAEHRATVSVPAGPAAASPGRYPDLKPDAELPVSGGSRRP